MPAGEGFANGAPLAYRLAGWRKKKTSLHTVVRAAAGWAQRKQDMPGREDSQPRAGPAGESRVRRVDGVAAKAWVGRRKNGRVDRFLLQRSEPPCRRQAVHHIPWGKQLAWDCCASR